MVIETYKGFEIFQDAEMFDLFSFRGTTVGDFSLYGAWNKNPTFKTIDDVKIFIDGYFFGYSARNPTINVNVWERKDIENYSQKILKDTKPLSD